MTRKIVKINTNTKSKIIVLITMGIFLALLPAINNGFNFNAGNNDLTNLGKENLKISAVTGKIHIDNNWTATESTYSWCTGSGTWNDPYIIDDLEIDGEGSGVGIWIENSDVYFKVENCTVYNSEYGVVFNLADNGILINNNCTNNNYGMEIINCKNSTISGNTVNNNQYDGILLNYCNNNTISGNTANNTYGISLYWSNNNTVSGNIANNNPQDGLSLYWSNNTIISGNTVNNNNRDGIYLENCEYNNISGNTVNSNLETGIHIPDCINILVSENNVSSNGALGIGLESGSFHNVILNNMISNSGADGISMGNSDYNNISGNTLDNNPTGIYIDGGVHNLLLGNIINNGIYGMGLWNAYGSIISNNSVKTHDRGISLENCNNNNISGNSIDDNDYGIFFDTCENNMIFHNTIEGNLVYNAYDNGTSNRWDNGTIGNYWDDYSGVDANDDGIGDIPYDVPPTGGSMDNYPIWEDGDDGAPPVIEIVSPVSDQVFSVGAPSFQIEIMTLYTNITWYTIDNGLTNYTFSGLTGTVNQTAWDDKETEIMTLRFYANDSLGNLGLKDVSIWKDVIPPQITINSPTPNELYGIEAPPFSLTIDELNLQEKRYSLNGRPNITFTTETQFSQSEWDNIGNGTVTISFYAIDKAGNSNSSEIIVRKDAYIPDIIINSPSNGETFGRNPPTFNISIIEEDLNSTFYTIIETGLYQYFFTGLTGEIDSVAWDTVPEGNITITFYTLDRAGNLGTESVTVVKSIPSPPGVPIELIILISVISGGAVIGVATVLLIRRKRN